MKKNGYTIIELLITLGIVGVIFFVLVTKTSHAFDALDTSNELIEVEENILMTSATKYAESIKDTFKEENPRYFLAQDLIDAKYLLDSEDTYKGVKLKITYHEDTDQFTVEKV